MSVFGIGPAGENLVRFAAIVGDKGHVAAHNGVGAVMGSKRLKAIAVTRGQGRVIVKDKEQFSAIAKVLVERVKTDPVLKERVYKWGTLDIYERMEKRNLVPIKNYTTNIYPDKAKLATFTGPYIRDLFEKQAHPCWACQMHHCHLYKITEGPFTGRIVEEPEYEGLAAWGGQIGQTDVVEAILLSNEVDRLGMDWCESGWLIGFMMECYEKGLITEKDTDGLEMTWGNIAAVRAMLNKIVNRQGVGDLLAEGTMRVARHLGGEALKLAIYTEKGNTPRSHDHRANWHQLFDTCVSDTGTIEAGPAPELQPAELADLGLSPLIPPFSWEEAATSVARLKGIQLFEDSMGTCRFTTLMGMKNLAKLVKAATGWQFTMDEAMEVGLRIANLLRVFNIRHGISGDLDAPSLRYGSTPLDGLAVGKSIMPFWEQMLRRHHKLLGWDETTGKPLPDTLKRLGLEHTIRDIW
jgi:aldehyde:ferredoxin oxidoreductase